MSPKGITRRDFLREGTSATLAGAFFLSLPKKLSARSEKATRVVLIRARDVLDDQNNLDGAVLSRMLDESVAALLGEKEPLQAWKLLIKPSDIVGIKTNGFRGLPVPSELEQAIKARVIDTGVKEANISIRDAGVLEDPVFQKSTALINTRPMRAHSVAGAGTCIKNYIRFIPNRSSMHPDGCADLASLWKLPIVKGKTRLNILVMLTPLFNASGMRVSPEYLWSYKGLLVGTDPVAVDATGLRIIQAKRREFFGEDRPLEPLPKHIQLADSRHGIGTADPEKIELIKLGWQENILI
ncbi:MAG: DUF362 domain-containing protein [Fidelibacterota bacterium]|nr:MAG: DUF362 domain-containing protein [Candidatus Neomarinimicrobiota bacterium]